jgi:hypothetical protein
MSIDAHMRLRPSPAPAFCQEALFYADEGELLAGLTFVRDGLAAGEPTLREEGTEDRAAEGAPSGSRAARSPPGRRGRGEVKAYWRDRLGALKAVLEG